MLEDWGNVQRQQESHLGDRAGVSGPINPNMWKPWGWDTKSNDVPCSFPSIQEWCACRKPHQRIASILPLFHFFFLKLPTRSLCQGRVFLCMKGYWDDLLWRASADNNWEMCLTWTCCWFAWLTWSLSGSCAEQTCPRVSKFLRGLHGRKGWVTQGRTPQEEKDKRETEGWKWSQNSRDKARARNKYHKDFWRCGERMKLSQKLFQERDLQQFKQSGQWGELHGHVYQKSPIRVMWFLSAKLFSLNKRLLLPQCWILFHHRETQRNLTLFMVLDKWQLSDYNSLKGSWCFNKL